MARRKHIDSEIREPEVAYDAGRTPATLPPPPTEAFEESPFRYGFRFQTVRDEDGRGVVRQIPLTLDDYLHPREGDLMTQGNLHQRLVQRLADVVRRWLEKTPGVGVLSDVLVRWGVAGLPAQAPDVAVVQGLERSETIDGSLDCAALGVTPCLAIEVVSTSHREYREKDTRDKVRIYERAGVAEYLIVDPPSSDTEEPYRLIGYRLDAAGRYQRTVPNESGAVVSETTGLRFVPDAERGVVVEVAASGERLLYSDEMDAALEASEKALREAEAELARLRGKLNR